MHPIDPGEHWLASGITGLPRQREWDAVATSDAPGEPGWEVEFVALAGGRLLVEDATEGFDPAPLAGALEGSIEPPYRATAFRREELWTIGATGIEAVRLDPDPRGDDLELTWDGSTLTLSVDGLPTDPGAAPALERLARGRESDGFAANAHRLDGELFEILVFPL
jgi:hypothetical protein